MFQSLEEIEWFFNDRKKIGIKPGLERMMYMLNKVGHPERKLHAIHVAGTNGKGSTIQFLKNALIANNYTVGLFTSPSFTGSQGYFLINNEEIKENDLLSVVNKLFPIIVDLDDQNMHPTEFEILTVIAFLYFEDKVDIAVIETGMGGRYDTTNCFSPIVAIITNIAKDHQTFLGETMTEIANHKAGIIKRNRPVVVGRINDESERVIESEAKKMNAAVYQLTRDFSYMIDKDTVHWRYMNEQTVSFTVRMKGMHQVDNASLAVMALYLLHEKNFNINWELVKQGIKATTLPGRFEKIHDKPTILLDSAHNVAGIEAFLHTIKQTYECERKHLIFAAFKDKQIDQMLQALISHFQTITVTTFNHERAASIDEFLPYIIDPSMQIQHDWKKEIQYILKNTANQNDIYFITGSMQFITLVRTYLT